MSKTESMGWNGPETLTLVSGETATTKPFNMESFKAIGFFSTQVQMTGVGDIKLEYVVSNVPGETDTDNFFTPSGASDIVSSHTATSGAAGTGVDLYQFPGSGEPIFAKNIALKLTEAGTTSAAASVTLYPNIQ